MTNRNPDNYVNKATTKTRRQCINNDTTLTHHVSSGATSVNFAQDTIVGVLHAHLHSSAPERNTWKEKEGRRT